VRPELAQGLKILANGSWLYMAETELSILTKQCLDRRIPDHPTLICEVAVWEKQCNEKHRRLAIHDQIRAYQNQGH
jgi:hypothetical protein